jgi:starch synthase (maltosyl-transferring)
VDGKDDTLITVVNLDPHNAHQAMIYLDYGALNLPENYKAVDEISGKHFEFGRNIYVDLTPVADVAHIFHIAR